MLELRSEFFCHVSRSRTFKPAPAKMSGSATLTETKMFCSQAAAINVAEGSKQAKILESEAEKQQLINEAQGSAQAVVAAGEARAKSILAVAEVSSS